MKKILLVAATIVSAMAFSTSCGESTPVVVDTLSVDSLVTDTTVVDSVALDSIVADTL